MHTHEHNHQDAGQEQAQNAHSTAGTEGLVEDLSAAMAAGQVEQTEAHSLSLLFESGVTQQNLQFQTSTANTVKGIQDIISGKNPLRGGKLNLKNDLAKSLEQFELLYRIPKQSNTGNHS